MKWLPWILFCSALLATLYSFFLLLNGGVALDNARSEVDRLKERSNLALSIVQEEWIGKNSSKLLDLSQRFEKEGVIVKRKGSTHEIGDIIFETENGIVVDVRYFD